MHLGESLSIGVREIAAHKMRSILTTLGVIFGVAAVIATVAIGAGAQEETLREISLLGTNNIRIRKVILEGAERSRASKRAPFGLTRDNLASLMISIEDSVLQYGVARKFEKKLSKSGESPTVLLMGVTPGYADAISFAVAPGQGRFLNNFDMEGQKQVCVIGYDIKQALFPLESPIGKKVQIDVRDFVVVGVMERKTSATGGVLDVGNLNQYVMIPLTTGLALFEADRRKEKLDEVVLKLDEKADLDEIAYLARRVLTARHGGVEDFEIIIPEALVAQKQRIQQIFGYTLIAIAGISLLVGGIGIMNIMLSSVTQRTKEIGVRRAIGATKQDIISQFIIESLVLSIVGGLMGVGFGFGLAQLISYYTHWNTPISIPAVAVSFSVAAMTGLIFGAYPAVKAADLDPIEALRHE